MNRRVYIYILVWIIFCVFKLNAQVGEIYNNYIPKVYLSDSDSKEMVYDVIDELCNVDPSLVYFYLEFLKQTELKSTRIKDAFRLFNYERNNSLKKIEKWVQEEIEIVNENSISFSQWLSCYHELYFFASSPGKFKPYNITYPVDNNFRYFIVYLYYNKQSLDYNKDFEMDYNKELDYKELINYFLRNLVAEFDNVYENTENLSLEELEIYLEKAKMYPYLFQNSYYEFINKQAKMRYSSFILKLSSIGYLENKNIYAGLGTQIKGEIKQNLSYKDPANYLVSGDFIFDTKNKTYVSIGVKIPFRRYKTFFSNLSMFVQYQVYSQHNENFKAAGPDKFTHLIKVTDYQSALVETYLKIDNIKIYSINSIFIKASTPIIFFSPNVSLELGTLMHYASFNYDYQINRNDKYLYPKWYYDESLLTNYNKKSSAIYNHISVIPYLSLNINLYNLIDLRLNTDTNAGIPLIEFYFNYSL